MAKRIVKTKNQKKLWSALEDDTKNYIAISGQAGTGKGFISSWWAAKALDKGHYDKLYLTRSAVGLSNEDLGHFPGSENEKMEVFIQCILQHLKKFLDKPLHIYLEDGRIEYVPLYTVRGRSFENSIVISSESQNLNIDTLKCLTTRISKDSVLILDGDADQSDLRKSGDNDFLKMCQAFDGNLDSFEWIQMTEEDCKRSGDIPKILELFKDIN